ncbi:hypothetical protein TSMEX_009161 [Taenia solium]|eukprot:TsM_000644300 transcript=TsM_000644300 gene=TsM_000644300
MGYACHFVALHRPLNCRQTERLTGSGDELDCCEEYSKTRGLDTTGSCFVELETTARRDLHMELGLVT